MHWLNRNINHFTLPLGMLYSLFAIAISFMTLRRRRSGAGPLVIPNAIRAGIIVFLLAGAVLLGIALSRNA